MVRHEDLVPYYHAVIKMTNLFDGFYIGHVSQFQNTKADTLAALAATLSLSSDTIYHFIVVDVLSVQSMCWKLMKSI